MINYARLAQEEALLGEWQVIIIFLLLRSKQAKFRENLKLIYYILQNSWQPVFCAQIEVPNSTEWFLSLKVDIH